MLSWDPTHDHVLYQFRHERIRIRIEFSSSPPSINELAAIRRVLPQFQNSPVSPLREAVGPDCILALGVFPTREALPIIRAVEDARLKVIWEDVSFESFLPFDRTTGCAWLIEDDGESAETVAAMLAAGVPVEFKGSL